jgi:hypothetical protein
MGLTMKEKQSLMRETGMRYRVGSKQEKTNILDEFTQVTGYHRKYALAVLSRWGKEQVIRLEGELIKVKAGTAKRRKGGGRKPIYGPEVIASLRLIWAFFW